MAQHKILGPRQFGFILQNKVAMLPYNKGENKYSCLTCNASSIPIALAYDSQIFFFLYENKNIQEKKKVEKASKLLLLLLKIKNKYILQHIGKKVVFCFAFKSDFQFLS